MLSILPLLVFAETLINQSVHILSMANYGKKRPRRQFLGGKSSGGINHILLAWLCCAGAASAQDGYWVGGSGGSWAGAGNWDQANGIAGGADNTAYFGFAREASISPNAAFTLDGAQTIGNICLTTRGGPASWSFNPGAGGSLTLDSTFGASQITVADAPLQVILNAAVAGGQGVEKDGPGTLVLGAANSYAGPTIIRGGGLNVTGSIGTGPVQVNNAILSGTGVINGPVVVGSGGTLSLGNSTAPLTINNSLVLLPGSTTSVSLNDHPAVQGLTSVTYGGTLLVSNLAGALSLGRSFSIFGSVSASGNFTNIQPPPGPWLRWRMDPGTGQITVVSSASQPSFARANLAGRNLVCQVTAGPPGSAGYLVASDNLNLPRNAWRRLTTNMFDMSGNFTCTNALDGDGAGQVYLEILVVAAP